MIAVKQLVAAPEAPPWALDMAATINEALSIIVTAMNKSAAAAFIVVTTPTTASQPFTIPHTLNAMPKMVTGLPQATGSIYATPEDKKEWSKSSVRVRCTIANTAMIVKVEA